MEVPRAVGLAAVAFRGESLVTSPDIVVGDLFADLDIGDGKEFQGEDAGLNIEVRRQEGIGLGMWLTQRNGPSNTTAEFLARVLTVSSQMSASFLICSLANKPFPRTAG